MSVSGCIAMTVSEATEPGATAAAEFLKNAGRRTQLFRIEDGGGKAFESFITKGQASAALDYTLNDLADMRLRGNQPMSADRLTSASSRAIPQVIVPGGLDHSS